MTDKTTIKAIIDHKIRVSIRDLPDDALGAICEALAIPNLAREHAKKMDIYGWQRMPERINLFEIEIDSGKIVMPRGFLGDFAAGMEAFDLEVELVDRRAREDAPYLDGGEDWTLFPWQDQQIDAIESWEQGIIKSPAGSGKTVMILAAIQNVLVDQGTDRTIKSIVIVNTKDIVWQWISRARAWFGEDFNPGQIGDGVFDVSPHITIATAQTLHSRYEALEKDGFFDSFGFVCLDEAHHATAETYNRILNRFSARYRVGVSATPDKTGDFALATHVLGPIIHTTPPSQVTNLLKPSVVKVPTRFGFGFRGHRNRNSRSNYPEMVEALIGSKDRNELIVKTVMENQGHHQLLVTKRLEHIETLQTMLEDAGFRDEVMTLTGKDKNDHREMVVQVAMEDPSIILSTLADEALDIPRLDRIHLVFPQRNSGLVTQQVGRVERKHPDKIDAKIFDYVDGNVGALDAQWRVRRTEVYMPRRYSIEVRRQT